MARRSINTSDQAVAFLMSQVRDDPRPYHARARLAQHPVRALLARVGEPQVDLPVVHIAGSKGKGSTALYLEAILKATGLRTGAFTSPHLQRWTERYRVDGNELTSTAFAALFARLQPHVLDLAKEDAASAPSFFDVLTAAAFLLFAEKRVDCAIIEAGIGGRLDATNVVQPMLSCITSVELEHTDKLGNSIAAIAGEKAGIIKKAVPVVIGALPGEAESVVRTRAAKLDATVSALEQDIALSIGRAPGGGLTMRVTDDDRQYTAELPAPASRCTARNAALAIACAHRICPHDETRLQRAVARAVPATRPPGRMEVVGKKPWVIIDGAHTPASTRALAEMLKGLPAHKMHLLVSLSVARDAAAVLAPLLNHAHSVVVTSADPTRSLDSEQLAADLVAGGYPASRLRAIPDPRKAVRESRATLAREDLLCVAGSMYMAGVAREMLVGGGDASGQTP
jgi:dihydrofolate synthase/folylpolyglutamate synthase